MLTGYNIVNLADLVETYGEESVKERLAVFSSINKDVEYFLRYKAIEFSKQGISKTHLIYMSYKSEPVIVGYYSLANKVISIHKDSLSSAGRKRIKRFGSYDPTICKYTLSSFLIGQLGKNYTNAYNERISGDELLNIALGQLSSVQSIVGGKYVYLECENVPKLIEFYTRNGFVMFGERSLDRDEVDFDTGKSLTQLLFDMRNYVPL